MPNFARLADMVSGLRGAIVDYRNNDRQAMQDKLNMVKQFMDVHSQEQRGQLETAQAREAAMKTSLMPYQFQQESALKKAQTSEQESLAKLHETEVVGKTGEMEARKTPLSDKVKQSIKEDYGIDVGTVGELSDFGKALEPFTRMESSKVLTEQRQEKIEESKQLAKMGQDMKSNPYFGKYLAGVDTVTPATMNAAVKMADIEAKVEGNKDKQEQAGLRKDLLKLQIEKEKLDVQKAAEGEKGLLPSQQKNLLWLQNYNRIVKKFTDVGIDPDTAAIDAWSIPTDEQLRDDENSLFKSKTAYLGSVISPDAKVTAEYDNRIGEVQTERRILHPEIPSATEPTAKETASISVNEYMGYTPQARTEYVRQQANRGIKRIELADNDGNANQVVNIQQDVDGNYIITNAEGKQLGKIGRVTPKPNTKQQPATQPTSKPVTKPSRTLTEEQKRALLDKLAGD